MRAGPPARPQHSACWRPSPSSAGTRASLVLMWLLPPTSRTVSGPERRRQRADPEQSPSSSWTSRASCSLSRERGEGHLLRDRAARSPRAARQGSASLRFSKLRFSHSGGCATRLVLVLFCVSPVTSGVEIFSSAHRPSRVFCFGLSDSVICPFFKNRVICRVIKVFVLGASPLSGMCMRSVFSQPCFISHSTSPGADVCNFEEVRCPSGSLSPWL